MVSVFVIFFLYFLSKFSYTYGKSIDTSVEHGNRTKRFACNLICDNSVDPDYYGNNWDYKFDGRVFCTQLCGRSQVTTPRSATRTSPSSSTTQLGIETTILSTITTTIPTTDSKSASTIDTTVATTTGASGTSTMAATTEKEPATDFDPSASTTSSTSTSTAAP